MNGPDLVVGAVVVDDERLLLIRRATEPGANTWAFPGGRVEHGEMIAEAVTRELREETGIEGICGGMIGWSEIVPDDPTARHLVILDYEVTLLDSQDPVAGSDAADARWFPLSDVADLTMAPGMAEFLHDHGIIATIT
ncbi:MAG: NUDIX hydrolase [Aquihabitans sp.]